MFSPDRRSDRLAMSWFVHACCSYLGFQWSLGSWVVWLAAMSSVSSSSSSDSDQDQKMEVIKAQRMAAKSLYAAHVAMSFAREAVKAVDAVTRVVGPVCGKLHGSLELEACPVCGKEAMAQTKAEDEEQLMAERTRSRSRSRR